MSRVAAAEARAEPALVLDRAARHEQSHGPERKAHAPPARPASR